MEHPSPRPCFGRCNARSWSAGLANGALGAGADHHDADTHGGTKITAAGSIHVTLPTAPTVGAIASVGVGGHIDGVLRPQLAATEGSIVEATIMNADGTDLDIRFPGSGVTVDPVDEIGGEPSVGFRVAQGGIPESAGPAAHRRGWPCRPDGEGTRS